jgi:primosomal protein N' (replication factor Y)
MQYYLIAPTIVVRNDQPIFTYHNLSSLQIGTIVQISVGKRLVNGVVIAETKKPLFPTKPILKEMTSLPLPRPLVELAEWLSAYYATHLATVLQTILPAGLQKKRRDSNTPTDATHRDRTSIVLNTQQAQALSLLSNKNSGTHLLHGVTGAGKTQVYIELAKLQRAASKSSIILVPEIALTPQLVAEFKNHFEDIVFTHSGISESERHQVWLKCLEATKPMIVIGPRSALFMPLPNVGLIVLDECHEPSYKQEQSPRYSALRAATMLGRFHQALVIFGSATPSVSDYYLAESSEAPIIELTKTAISTPKPAVILVDSKNRDNFRRHRFVSDALLAVVSKTIKDKQQVLIFHNRRGTAPAILCSHCGWQALCSGCHVPQTLHADQHILICHICGKNQPMMSSCPDCRHPDVIFRGVGTKLVEEEIKKAFPNSRVARFDADNAKHEMLQARYQQLYNGEIDIIIGTQLLAKGLDLPNLRAVGIIQADIGLQLPEYQAEERVFQLIYQVAGRIGRTNHQTQLVVQTYMPQHPIIQLALARDFAGFYKQQLLNRKTSRFPPFVYLLKLTCSYKTETGAIRAASLLAKNIESGWPEVVVLGPAPAFYERQGGNHRWQLLVKSRQRALLVDIAKSTPPKWQADLDPASIL